MGLVVGARLGAYVGKLGEAVGTFRKVQKHNRLVALPQATVELLYQEPCAVDVHEP